MNLLDIRTIVLSYAVTNIVCAWFVMLLWLQSRDRFAGLAFLVIDFILQAAALILIILRGSIPDWMSMVVSNTLVVVGAILGFMGLERFVGKKGPQIHNYLLVTLFILIHGYFTVVQPRLAVRNLNIAVALLLVCVQSVWLMWRRIEPGLRSLTFGVGLVNFLYCLVSVVRIVQFLIRADTENNYFQSGAFEALVLVSYQVLFIMLTYSLVLMVNKRLTMQIGASEEHVRLLLNSTAEAIYGINLEGKCTFANPSCLRMLGYTDMTQLLGKNMHELIHHSYPDGNPMTVEVCRIYQACREGKGMHVADEVLWKADGSGFPVEYWSYPQIVDGEVTGAVVTFTDITKRQHLEEELRRREKQHRLLIETLPLAVFVDTQGKIVYVNPAFLTLFKASSPDKVIGMRLIDFVSPDLFDTIEKRRRIMIQEKRIVPPLELNLRCMDGTFITVVSTPMPIVFEEQPAILSAVYDITERKHNEIELQKAHKLLQIQVHEIEDLQVRLKEQVIRDPLTSLFNRRYLEETLDRELARASRAGFPIGVVMIDIDHFKQVNDTHGHKAGDLILQALGKLLVDRIRAGDIACRYGGEEFLLILPRASREITVERAEQWRAGFEALRILYGEKALQATISVGVAVYPADGVTMEAVIRAADESMYRAKALGRNRVVLS